VTTRGSLYLFFPSLSSLRRLYRPDMPWVLRWRTYASKMLYQSREARAQIHSVSRAQLVELRLPSSTIQVIRALLLARSLDSTTAKTVVDHFAVTPRRACEPPPPQAAEVVESHDIKPLDPAFIANPHATYKRLRDQGKRIVWVPEHQAYWVLTHQDVARLFDHGKFVQQPSAKLLRGLLTMDAARHAVARPIVNQAFTVAISDLAKITDEVISLRLARLERLEQFDFVQEYGNAVPRTVFWRIFGLPEADVPRCDALAQTVMRHFKQPSRPGMADPIASADASVRLAVRLALHLAKALLFSHIGIGPYAGTLIGEIAKRTKPGLGAYRTLEFAESLVTLVQLSLVHMSAQFLLGTAMRHLLTPDARSGTVPWSELAKLYTSNRPAFDVALQKALDEARRIDPPVTIVERFAAFDQNIAGIDVKKDCPVFAVVASANRDQNVGSNPEDFQWDRDPAVPHLSLGQGIHECVGKMLQLQLVGQALTRLIAVMPSLRLCDATSVPAWIDNIYFRCLESLPVSRRDP
jgi:cytochrome P450